MNLVEFAKAVGTKRRDSKTGIGLQVAGVGAGAGAGVTGWWANQEKNLGDERMFDMKSNYRKASELRALHRERVAAQPQLEVAARQALRQYRAAHRARTTGVSGGSVTERFNHPLSVAEREAERKYDKALHDTRANVNRAEDALEEAKYTRSYARSSGSMAGFHFKEAKAFRNGAIKAGVAGAGLLGAGTYLRARANKSVVRGS